jgi:hypothetical protein
VDDVQRPDVTFFDHGAWLGYAEGAIDVPERGPLPRGMVEVGDRLYGIDPDWREKLVGELRADLWLEDLAERARAAGKLDGMVRESAEFLRHHPGARVTFGGSDVTSFVTRFTIT